MRNWGPRGGPGSPPASQLALGALLLAALLCGVRAAPFSILTSVAASFLLGSRATRELQGLLTARLYSLLCDLLPSHVVQDLLLEEEESGSEGGQPRWLPWFQARIGPHLLKRGQSWLREAAVRTPSFSSCPLPAGGAGPAPGTSSHCARAESSCSASSSQDPCTPPPGADASAAARWQRRTEELLSAGSFPAPHSPTVHCPSGHTVLPRSLPYPAHRPSLSLPHLSAFAQLALAAVPFDPQQSRGASLDNAAPPPGNASLPLPSPLRSAAASAGAALVAACWSPLSPACAAFVATPPCDVPSRLRRRSDCHDEPASLPTPRHPPVRRSSTMGVLSPAPSSQHETPFAEAHDCVTILFADVVGFTHFAQQVTCMKVLATLNDLYGRFDALCSTMPVYKIQVIGDAYMCATGLMHNDPDHAETMLRFAQAMLLECEEVLMPHTGEAVQIRVGISSGSVMSGLVGRIRRQFSVFGETVNTASRMEATSHAGGIHISESTHALLSHLPHWPWASQCSEVKSMGRITTYMLHPEPPFTAPSAYVSTCSSVAAVGGTAGAMASRSSIASTPRSSLSSTRSLPLLSPATPPHSAYQEPLASCKSWNADAVRAAMLLLRDSTVGFLAFSPATSSDNPLPAVARRLSSPPLPPLAAGPALVVPRQPGLAAAASAAAAPPSSGSSLHVHVWSVRHDKVFLSPCELAKGTAPLPHRHAVVGHGTLTGQDVVAVAAALTPPPLPGSCRPSLAGPSLWRRVSLGCSGVTDSPSLHGWASRHAPGGQATVGPSTCVS